MFQGTAMVVYDKYDPAAIRLLEDYYAHNWTTPTGPHVVFSSPHTSIKCLESWRGVNVQLIVIERDTDHQQSLTALWFCWTTHRRPSTRLPPTIALTISGSLFQYWPGSLLYLLLHTLQFIWCPWLLAFWSVCVLWFICCTASCNRNGKIGIELNQFYGGEERWQNSIKLITFSFHFVGNVWLTRSWII